jgi:hypothetical protein
MAALSLSDKLQTGKQYTFRFLAQQTFVPRAGDVATHLQRAYSFLSDVAASRGLTSNLYAVSFTWTGVPNNAGDVAGNMLQIIATDGAFEFVGAQAGTSKEPLVGSSVGSEGGIGGQPIKFPSVTTVVLIVAGVLILAVFAGVFGKGLAERI